MGKAWNRSAWLLPLLLAGVARADEGDVEAPDGARDRTQTRLPAVAVDGKAEAMQTPGFPATTASVDAAQAQRTTNLVDVEDAAKYLPSLFVRKRNYGDTQPVLATRTWGLGASARTLVYVDDIPISALIANNNTLGAPRWGVVAADAVQAVTMGYGPFSAADAGNALGGVMRIVTRQPEHTDVRVTQTEALQSFAQYRSHGDYSTSQTSASAGGRAERYTWFVGANLQNSFSQPLAYITAATAPAGTSGAIEARNKLGQPADVLGAGGLLHTRMGNLDAKFGVDLGEAAHLDYLAGYWDNDASSRVETYLLDAAGTPTYAKAAGFASNTYTVDAAHLMQAAALRLGASGDWSGELIATDYRYLDDRQRSPASVAAGTQFNTAGRLAVLDGTGWTTLDAKAQWRPGAAQEWSFGWHGDAYTLRNTTYDIADWHVDGARSGVFTDGRGRTRTSALWLQDAWRFAPAWEATLGLRYEDWQASGGRNVSGGVTVQQPRESASAWSPKASLRWEASEAWRFTASLARAVRFPTVAELYQIVSTGSTFTSPNPDLAPERARSGEASAERRDDGGLLRVSLFQENTRDALIAQTATLAGAPVPVSFVTNVGEVRNRGVELVAERDDAGLRGLSLSGSVTFVDSTILANPSFVSTTGSTSVGKHAPNVPRWRATAVATYAPDEAWSFTLAGRYSGKMYSTVDNADRVGHVYGAFDTFLVFDARVHYAFGEGMSASLGVDNLNDRDYFLFHPFPRRTVVADMRLAF